MNITRKSMVTGIQRTVDLPITEMQVLMYENGALIQDAFPNLTLDQREFYMTGIVQEEWDDMCAELEADAEEDMGDSSK